MATRTQSPDSFPGILAQSLSRPVVRSIGLPKVRRVLIGTDLDTAHLDALMMGEKIAHAFGASLGVVNVMSPGFPDHAVSPHRHVAEVNDAEETAARMETLPERLQDLLGMDQSGFQSFVERGEPGHGIVERARRFPADLVVVGSHNRKGIERWLLGSVAEYVVRHAHCPVLVARPQLGPDGGVLAACDLEAMTGSVLRWAKGMAWSRAQSVQAVHTMQFGMGDVAAATMTFFAGAPPAAPDKETVTAMREVSAGALSAEMTAAGVNGDAEILVGPTVTTILDYAKEKNSSMIVLGTHGRTGIGRLLLGSVAEDIVRRAECSVLVVR